MRNEDDGMGIDPRTGEIKTLGELGRTPYQDEPFPSIFDTYGVRYAGFPVFLSPKVLPIERVTFIKTNPYAATLADTLSVETVYRIGLYEVFDRSTHHKNLDTSDGKSFSIITTAGIRVFRAREIFTTYSSNPLQQISNTISKFVSARVKVKTYEKYLKSDLSKFFDINELNVALKYIGVKVERFEVSDPEPSAKTQITLDTLATESTKIQEEEKKAAAAVFTKSKTITDAEAAKEKKRLEGEGEAAARQALLEAEALGQQKLNKAKAQEIDVLADKYKKTGMSKAGAYARATEIVLATRQAEAIGKLTGTYVAPSGDGGKGTNLLLGANSVGGNKKGGE
jgi:regulator of protease activity HflC (stomatin/prohibitin superfamily)